MIRDTNSSAAQLRGLYLCSYYINRRAFVHLRLRGISSIVNYTCIRDSIALPNGTHYHDIIIANDSAHYNLIYEQRTFPEWPRDGTQ